MGWIALILLKYRYLVLIPLAAFEGPLIALVVGFLVSTGVLNLWISYAIMIAGDIVPDSLFYAIGYYGSQTRFVQRMLSKSSLFRDHFPIVEKMWNEHGRKTMFFGKLAYGMALPFLVSAGMVKMPFKKFIRYAIPITLFQYAPIMAIGYFLGNSYMAAAPYLNYAYLLLGAVVVVLVVGYLIAARYARRKIVALEGNMERP